MRTAGSNRLRGELRAADFSPGSPSLDWTLSSTRANVRGCRRIQGLGGTSFWTVWTSPACGGSGSRPLGLLRQARSRVSSCAAFSCVRTPVPDPWRAFGRNPARSGRYGERDTRQRRSRRVRFCRHPSRPRVEWPDLPGRGSRQRLSVRRQNLSVPHYHRKANHRNPLVWTTLFRSDAQAQGLT